MNSGAFAAPKRGKGIPDPSSAGTYAEHALRSRYQMIGVFCRTNAGSFWMTNSPLLPKNFLGTIRDTTYKLLILTNSSPINPSSTFVEMCCFFVCLPSSAVLAAALEPPPSRKL